MAVIWCSGFEFGTTAGITTGPAGAKIFDAASTAAFTTSSPRTGTYALNLTGTNAVRSATLTSATLGGPAALTASFWVRFPSALPSNSPDLCCFGTNLHDGFMFYQATGTKLGVAWAGGATFDGPVVVADTWYLIDMLIDASANPHSLSWRVNKVAQPGTTAVGVAGTVTSWALGRVDAVSGTYHFDDAVVANTAAEYPLGEHKVVILTPDQASTLTVNGSTANWNTFLNATPTETAWSEPTARAAIDEIPLNTGSSQDGIAQVARTDSTHYVEIPMTTYTLGAGETVSGVRMMAAGWAATATAATFGIRSWNGSAETILQAGSVDPNFDNTTPAWICRMLTLADVDTQAELNALAFRVGFSTDVSPHIGIHAIYAEVAIKVPVTGTAVTALGTLSGTASGTVTPGGGSTVNGSAAASLGAASGSAVGTRTVTGAAIKALGALSATAAGTRTTSGSAASTLGALGATAAGTRTVGGSAQATLGGIAATAAGLRTVAGTAAVNLGAVAATASGSVVGAPVTGAAFATLGAAVGTVAGKRAVLGSAAASLGALSATTAGVRAIAGTSSAALGGNAATGAGLRIVTATGTAALPALSAVGVGQRAVTGVGLVSLGGLAAVAVSAVAVIPGTLHASLTGPTFATANTTSLTASTQSTSTLTPE